MPRVTSLYCHAFWFVQCTGNFQVTREACSLWAQLEDFSDLVGRCNRLWWKLSRCVGQAQNGLAAHQRGKLEAEAF